MRITLIPKQVLTTRSGIPQILSVGFTHTHTHKHVRNHRYNCWRGNHNTLHKWIMLLHILLMNIVKLCNVIKLHCMSHWLCSETIMLFKLSINYRENAFEQHVGKLSNLSTINGSLWNLWSAEKHAETSVNMNCTSHQHMQVFNQAKNWDLAQPHFVLICFKDRFMTKRDSHLQQGALCKLVLDRTQLKSGGDRL